MCARLNHAGTTFVKSRLLGQPCILTDDAFQSLTKRQDSKTKKYLLFGGFGV